MKIAVVGIGESGQAASVFLKSKRCDVYATDCGNSEDIKLAAKRLKSHKINVEVGRHTKEFIQDCDLMVVSPGVTYQAQPVIWAKEKGIEVISEIELSFNFCKGEIIAVTGTNGKTTTTTLISEIFKSAGKKVITCGNIGNAFCNSLDKITKDTTVVLEISSFQLAGIKQFRPKVAVILNVSQNHLDWHKDITGYISAKSSIYRNQKKEDFLLLNYDDPILREFGKDAKSRVLYFSRHKKIKGAYLENGDLFLDITRSNFLTSVKDIALNQAHNIENILAASLCAAISGISKDIIKQAIEQFKGLEHRFESLGIIDGIEIINDSKATTVDACRAALASCKSPVVLIAGGRDKGSDFNKIKSEVKKKVKCLILIGEAREKIKMALGNVVQVEEADTMDGAVKIARSQAKAGDCILLSPMCASFDMFKDYRERGGIFKKAIYEKLKV